jgi:hypothetical protein
MYFRRNGYVYDPGVPIFFSNTCKQLLGLKGKGFRVIRPHSAYNYNDTGI